MGNEDKYITALNGRMLKARQELKIYKDIALSKLTASKIEKESLFIVQEIVFSSKGNPRLKVHNGYVTANKKFVALTDEAVTKPTLVINGKEQIVREDIENYICNVEDQAVKALTDLKIYKDLAFKVVTDEQLKKGFVFKPESIEFSKGGTPRFKIKKGYVTTNKKFVALVNEKANNSFDEINYIDSLPFKYAKAINDLSIYEDSNLTKSLDNKIKENSIFIVKEIIENKNFNSLRIESGYISASSEDLEILSEVFFNNNCSQEKVDLSIVMPVYNVEEYLVPCLESILIENKINLEVIAVNDGATDNSEFILQEFYAKDSRLKIVHKINGGLGAARNTGAKYAKGKYIWFVDSDDIIDKDSINKAINQLNKTGSDFIVTSYTYLVNEKKNKPAYWIRELHKKSENNCNINDRPDVMVNVPAWTKIYRKEFWDKHNLAYPEKVLYEDQVPSIKSYTLSENFDIANFSTIQWRQRSGLVKSITQNHLDYKNLSARFEQGKNCIGILLEKNKASIAQRRALDYLGNKTFTLQNIIFCDQDYWDVLVSGVKYLYEIVSKDDYINYVDAQDKVLYKYILNNNIDAARDFIRLGGMKLIEHKTLRIDQDFYVELPHFGNKNSILEISDFKLSKKQTELITHLERIQLDKNYITITGNAYFALINFEKSENCQFELIIKDRVSKKCLERICSPLSNDVIEKRTQHYFNRYEHSAFSVKIDISEFENWFSSEKLKFGEFDLLIRLTDLNNGRTETAKFQGKSNRTEVAVTNSIILDSKNFMVCKWNTNYGLIFDYRAEPVVVYDKPRILKNSLCLVATRGSNHNFNPQYVQLDNGKDQHKLDLHLRSEDVFEINIPKELLNKSFNHYQLKVFDGQGGSRVIHCANKSLNFKYGQAILKVTHSAGLEIVDISSNFMIKSWILSDNRLIVELSQPLLKNIRSACLSSQKMKFTGRVFAARKKIEFDLSVNNVSDSSKLLNGIFFGGYQIRMFDDQGLELKNIIWFDNNLAINQMQSNELCKVTARIVTNNTSEFLIESKENVTRKGPIWGSSLRNYLLEQDKSKVLKNLVYLQCLRGDQVNDNQLAICNELLKRGGWKVVWGIEDNSVAYPKGTEAVLIGSNDYWNVIRHAKYLCFNHEVPAYLEAGKEQRIIQTYHGHPFKSMGMKRWSAANYTQLQIKESLSIREKWDYLMSPSPAATKMYKDNFPVRAKIIEVGHPRNDILSNFSEDFRQNLRDKIGIKSDKKAILFAPTWRDYSTSDPWSSSVPTFIKPEDLADKLGDEFVVLFRGHPAHGRNGVKNIHHDKVVDVTYWKDVNELLIACDIGVYDYSSIRFDHAVTRKPMVFFVPDKDLYFKHIPPLMDYDQTTPGAQVDTIEKLAIAITQSSINFDWKKDEGYSNFVKLFVPLDDGKATIRFVDQVFK